jgi:uncharacterized protein (TIGR02466 family)
MKVENYFTTPIYIVEKVEWLLETIKATDYYIEEAKELNKKNFYKKKDFGLVHHSKPIGGDPKLKNLTEYIGRMSSDILDQQGYDMKLYNLFISEMWVQEFAKHGGGHHSPHIHWNSHMSGFYFLKCSDKTSYPIFHDPRPGKMMSMLKQKNHNQINYSTEQVHFKIKPGTMIFFNSYLTHEFIFDKGIEPFRFIHFNVQASDKNYAI